MTRQIPCGLPGEKREMAAIDNGHVIPGLNESWTLLGAKASEWMSGLVAFMLVYNLPDKPLRYMPVLLGVFVATAVGMAALRRRFPDEEKGMRNYAAMMIGIQPPGIPAPAYMQPIWSGAPLRALPEESEFMQLGLTEVLEKIRGDNEPQAD